MVNTLLLYILTHTRLILKTSPFPKKLKVIQFQKKEKSLLWQFKSPGTTTFIETQISPLAEI